MIFAISVSHNLKIMDEAITVFLSSRMQREWILPEINDSYKMFHFYGMAFSKRFLAANSSK